MLCIYLLTRKAVQILYAKSARKLISDFIGEDCYICQTIVREKSNSQNAYFAFSVFITIQNVSSHSSFTF